jgi:phage terminase large subunit-like protein
VPLFGWQSDVVRRAMRLDDAGRYAHGEVVILCPRRNGKTQLLMARIIAGCLAGRENILYTAHLGDTARHMFKAFLELLGQSPWLRDQVAAEYHGKGDESILFRNGATFSIRARTNSGGRGMESDVLILDEALELTDDHMSALTPLLAKARAQGRGQLWVTSSAGHGRSEVLARYRDRGRAAAAGQDDATLAYFEWSAPRDASPTDPIVWAAANPSMGTPVLDADFLRMQQRSMTAEAFGREHLGWWTDEVADPFLPHGAWAACAGDRPAPPKSARIAFGVELQDYGHAVLVAAIDLGDGRAWVETVARWHDPLGLDPDQLGEQIREHVRAVRPFVVAGDDFTCTRLLDHLEHRGAKVQRLNQPAVRAASQTLLTAVVSGRLTHPTDAATDADMGSAGQAPTGDGLLRLSRKNSTGRSTAAFAVAAAVHAVLGPRPPRPTIVLAR